MPETLVLRLEAERASTADFDTMAISTLQAKYDNWNTKVEEGQIAVDSELFEPTISFLDYLGFEIHQRKGRSPSEYVSFRTMYLDSEAVRV